MRIDIAEELDGHTARRVLLAARLFLEGNFEEHRADPDGSGLPKSAGNCWAAARFLVGVLHEAGLRGPGEDWMNGRWMPVHGWCLDTWGVDDSHCFAAWMLGGDVCGVADLTADQFGHAEIVFGDLDDRYAVIKSILRNPQGKNVAAAWRRRWVRQREQWLAAADAQLDGLATSASPITTAEARTTEPSRNTFLP